MNKTGLVFACAIAAFLGIVCGYIVSVVEFNKLRSEKMEIGVGNASE